MSINASESIFSALTLLVAAMLTACSDGRTEPRQAAEPVTRPFAVEVATATLETLPEMTRASGSLEPLRRVSPGSKILSRVDHVAVREGDPVAQGALLARLESRDLESAVHQAEAAERLAEAVLDNARAQRDRMGSLHGRGSATDKSLEDATAAFRVAAASVAQAQANLTAARVRLSYAEIRSPLTGWVVARRVETGDMATPGAPLFTLEDSSRVKVIVQVPETEVVGLRAGEAARVEILDREIEAVVDRVVPAGEPASRTFAVQLLLDNPAGELKSGMFARVSFLRGERQALRVATSALVTRGQLEGLFVAGEDGRVRLRWVRTGHASAGHASAGHASAGRASAGHASAGHASAGHASAGHASAGHASAPGTAAAHASHTEILSGLAAGERYVVAPPPGLIDGARYTETGR